MQFYNNSVRENYGIDTRCVVFLDHNQVGSTTCLCNQYLAIDKNINRNYMLKAQRYTFGDISR